MFDEWTIINEFDRGDYDGIEFHRRLVSKLGWHGSLGDLESLWQNLLLADQQMLQYLVEIKNRGFRTYILSNINPFHLNHILANYPQLTTTAGQIYSCECGMVKPDERIYRHLQSTFGIYPQESFFIDDRLRNIQAAEQIGFQGLLHRSASETIAALDSILTAQNQRES